MWIFTHTLEVTAGYITGKKKFLIRWVRYQIPTEWSHLPHVFDEICRNCRITMVDLFVPSRNHKLPVYMILVPNYLVRKGVVRSNTNGIISVSMLPPFHSDLSSHQPGNGLIRSHSDSSYSTLVTSWMVCRPVVTSGDQTPGAFKSVASSSTPQWRKFHRASDIIRLQKWSYPVTFWEGRLFWWGCKGSHSQC